MLNNELSKNNESLMLVCAGGYVMQLHGYRATADVYAFFKSNAAVAEAIRKVGNSCGLNKSDELWLNNSIARLNKEPSLKYYKQVHKYSNLEVHAVDINYLIGMKYESAREQDLKDISAVLKREDRREPLELLSLLVKMGFNIDISLLLETFEVAHGMEWLAQFYKENESELIKYF